MFNRSRLKNAALLAAGAAGLMGADASAKQDVANDFKFPIVLCRFKQAVLKDSGGGILKVTVDQDWGPEHAFPVGNVRSLNTRADDGRMARVIDGDFAGHYDIPGSPYRLSIEGSIQQGLDAETHHQMRLRSYLEKKSGQPDANGNTWRQVGQAHYFVPARAQTDGTVWENVYPYTFNSLEMSRYVSGGKLKQEKVIAGIRDGLLEKGAVFKVGPACGFLDGRTAKTVASGEDRARFSSIFDRIPDVTETPVVAAQAPASAEAKKVEKAPAVLHESQVASQEPAQTAAVAQQEPVSQQQIFSQQQTVEPGQGDEMSPHLQAELARQNQLADQAAAQYNVAQQQSQYAVVPTAADSRDPASAQTPEQIQQQLSQLEQQRQALTQQQTAVEQQQQVLAQQQRDIANGQSNQEQDGNQF